MARVAFLDEVEPHAIYSMFNAGGTIDEAADAYDALVAAAPPIDIIHLGLGPDGHTASLFPGTPALDVPDRLVVTNGDDLHPHPRLTFTYPAIARGQLVVFTVAGEEKREVLRRVRESDDLPATRVRADRVIWLVDEAAADPT
jgi:6-phosphogluconolactonase